MFIIIYGDIGDIDYLDATGPFATREEATAEGERLTAEGKLPDEAELEEVAWRVVALTAPADLTVDYGEEEDY